MKKYKQVNRNNKIYNEIAQLKIKEKKKNKKLDEAKEKIKMFEAIKKKIKVNVKDENYK